MNFGMCVSPKPALPWADGGESERAAQCGDPSYAALLWPAASILSANAELEGVSSASDVRQYRRQNVMVNRAHCAFALDAQLPEPGKSIV